MVDPLPEETRITSTTTPAPEAKTFADYILILPFPNLPPIYVYLSQRKGMPEKGHSYHPAPKTEEITGIPNLIEVKWRTPKQG